jgi:threonine-phosphate decarboxylase
MKPTMKHGANIYKYAKKLHCNANEIIDFSSNINAYHPTNKLILKDEFVVPYADKKYQFLKKTIAKKYHIKKSQLQLYSGATSAIYELFKALKPKELYLYAPLYSEYENAAPKKCNITKINRFQNLNTPIKKNATIVFVNPSTPDAKFYYLKKLFKKWTTLNCTIILDESFLEFEDLPSFRTYINSYDKLYIVQSFSKYYACAGVRVGAIFSCKKNIEKLHTPLWSISSLDAQFLQMRLSDKSFEKDSKKYHDKQKKELFNILQKSKLFNVITPSSSNYFLVRCTFSKELFKHLLKYKILIRAAESFEFLNPSYLRFAVKDESSHKELKKALEIFTQ